MCHVPLLPCRNLLEIGRPIRQLGLHFAGLALVDQFIPPAICYQSFRVVGLRLVACPTMLPL
jgi:hypothetical protein